MTFKLRLLFWFVRLVSRKCGNKARNQMLEQLREMDVTEWSPRVREESAKLIDELSRMTYE